jgi:hypothetical protein
MGCLGLPNQASCEDNGDCTWNEDYDRCEFSDSNDETETETETERYACSFITSAENCNNK